MPHVKPKPKLSKAVKTRFGFVDRKAIEHLRETYDTFDLGDATDAVDQVRYRGDELRENIIALHGMAMNLINDNFAAPGGRVPEDESIGELADRITDELLDCIKYLEKAYKAVKPLGDLIADPDDYADAQEFRQAE